MELSTRNRLTEKFWGYLLFFIWPLAGFIYYIRNLNSNYTNVNGILVLFYCLFGFTFVYSETADSFNHASDFLQTVDLSFSVFFERLFSLYSINNQKPDILLDLINFIVSRFTNDTRFFFMTLSLFFSIALVKNINLLKSVYEINRNQISFIFLLFFFILLPPSRILSFRHYLALLVFVFGVYKYFKEKNTISFLIIISTIFIHFGFIIAVGLFFIYKFVGNRNIIYYVLIISSFLFYEQAVYLLRNFGIIGLEIGLADTVSGYTNEGYLESVSEAQLNRLAIVNSYIKWTSFFMLISVVYHKLKWKKFDKTSEKLYSFSLLFFAFVNFSQDMEALTNRFGVLFQILCCIFFIRLYAVNKNIRANLLFRYTSIAFFCINLIILTRLTIQYTNILQLIPVYPLSFIVDSDITILDFIK